MSVSLQPHSVIWLHVCPHGCVASAPAIAAAACCCCLLLSCLRLADWLAVACRLAFAINAVAIVVATLILFFTAHWLICFCFFLVSRNIPCNEPFEVNAAIAIADAYADLVTVLETCVPHSTKHPATAPNVTTKGTGVCHSVSQSAGAPSRYTYKHKQQVGWTKMRHCWKWWLRKNENENELNAEASWRGCTSTRLLKKYDWAAVVLRGEWEVGSWQKWQTRWWATCRKCLRRVWWGGGWLRPWVFNQQHFGACSWNTGVLVRRVIVSH